MEHHSIERHVLILFSRKLFPASFDKEDWNLVFFETDSIFTIAKCAFQRRRFSNVSAGSLGFLLTCMGKVVVDRDWYFWQPNFFAAEFLAKTIENPVF